MLRHELLKLSTTRWIRVTALVVVVISMGMAYLLGRALGPDLAIIDPEAPSVLALALRTATAGPILAGIIGAWSLSADIRDGTLRPTLLAEPRRLSVLRAKVAATCVVTGVIGVVCGLGATAAVAMAGSVAPGVAWLAGPLAHGAATMIWGVVGLVVAVFIRPAIGAVFGALAWPLLGEPLVAQVLTARVADLLPFRSVGALYAIVDEATIGAGRVVLGLLPMLCLLGLVFAVAARRFRTVEI